MFSKTLKPRLKGEIPFKCLNSTGNFVYPNNIQVKYFYMYILPDSHMLDLYKSENECNPKLLMPSPTNNYGQSSRTEV